MICKVNLKSNVKERENLWFFFGNFLFSVRVTEFIITRFAESGRVSTGLDVNSANEPKEHKTWWHGQKEHRMDGNYENQARKELKHTLYNDKAKGFYLDDHIKVSKLLQIQAAFWGNFNRR